MSPVDLLSPDQRAVLQLLLKQGKTYDELAGLLRIDASAVRERAVAALEALGPRDGSPPAPERRGEIADYLLGQQSASERASTREHLEGSASGRAWARVVSGELRPLGGDALPEVPAEGAEVDEAFGALQARTARREEVQRSSKIGGAILLAGVAIALIAVIFIATRSGDDDPSTASTPTTTSTTATTGTGTSTTGTNATQPDIVGQVNLRPPGGGGGKALGVANILSQGGQQALAIQGQNLPRSTEKIAYAVWLTRSGGSKRLGFAPPVGKDGRLSGVAGLPSDAARFNRLIITRESSNAPKTPGTIVLAGEFSVRGGS